MRTNSARISSRGAARPSAAPRAAAAFLAAHALGWTAVAASQLWQHVRADEPRPYRASAALVLLGLAGLSAAWSRRVWRRRSEDRPCSGSLDVYRRVEFWGLLLLSLAAGYAVCLALGPTPYARYWFRVVLAGATLLAARPAVEPAALAGLVAWWTQRRVCRAAFHGAILLIALAAASEVALRGWSYCTGADPADACLAVGLKFAPGAEVYGRRANQLGYADDEFSRGDAGPARRVCLLGDELWLADEREPNCLASLEQLLSNCELCNCALPSAHPRAYRAQFDRDVAALQPDLVLACVSLRDDLTHAARTSSPFDYRGLRCYQWGVAQGWGAAGGERSQLLLRSDDYESFVTTCSASLAACRTPVPQAVEAQWSALLGALDRLAEGCRAAGVPLGLVVAPAEYQVSPALCQTLCRRAGCSRAELDLQLPQRRLAQFAAARQLPLFDLTPVLQTSREPALEPNSSRWSEAASRLAAGALAPWLARQWKDAPGPETAQTVALAQPR